MGAITLGFRVVPEGDALVVTLGFGVVEVLLRSSWVWVVPEGDALAISLGFNRSRSATAIILGLGCSRRRCTRY